MDEKTVMSLAGLYSFYDKEMTQFALEVWADALSGFDDAQIRAAIQAHIKDPDSGRWLPKPADLIRKLQGNAEDQALIAWGQVMAHGGELDEAAQLALQVMGGRSAIGRAQESENGFLQKRFVELYRAYKRRADLVPLQIESTAESTASAKIVQMATGSLKRL